MSRSAAIVPDGGRKARQSWLLGGVFVLSAALSLFLIQRGQVAGDQLNLLARGWLLAQEGTLVPYGNPGSGGGATPGAATSLLMAGPLLLWRDPRAPALLLLATHLVAFWLLDRLARAGFGAKGRLAFAVLYGLSPTRLYFSAVLWNPGFLLLAGAVHAWTLFRQRSEGRFLASAVHALTLALAFQLHPSAVILGAASIVVWLRGGSRVSWTGLFTGGLVGSLTLIPYLYALGEHADLVPIGKGFLGRGLLLLFPLAHGILNWFRHTSLDLSREAKRFDFGSLLGERADGVLTPVLTVLAGVVGAVTVVVALAAAWWWLRRLRVSRALLRFEPRMSARAWLDRYALACFVAALGIYAIAPTTPMWWQGVSVLHAALWPTARWAGALLRSRWRRRAGRGLLSWSLSAIVLVLLMGTASQQFRCGGRHNVVLSLAHDHPMFDGLGLRERCHFAVNAPGGWWPDVLPRSRPELSGRRSANPGELTGEVN